MKKVFITGGSGLIGRSVTPYLMKEFRVVGGYNFSPDNCYIETNKIQIDVTNPDLTNQVVREVNPDVIIHLAGKKNVKFCEENKEEATKINVTGTKNVATAASDNDCFFIYISSDYIFSGEKGNYKENAKPRPFSHYGVSKFEGEKFVRAICSKYTICRLSAIYHPVEGNFMHFFYNSLKSGVKNTYFTDVYNSPLCIENLATILSKVIALGKNETIHCAGLDCTNRYEFALKLAKAFEFDQNLIGAVELGAEKRSKLKYPLDISLKTEKLEQLLGFKTFTLEEGFEAIRKSLGNFL
jgi:dTDP-4-dehydrorhamnose reductase